MTAKSGRLPASGSISVSQVNDKAGVAVTGETSLGDNHMRAFQGGRETNTTTSLGDARGRAVTWNGFLKRSGISASTSIPTFSMTEYFDPSQMSDASTLYTTSEITDDWWGPLNDPRNMNMTFGTTREVTFGGTGGKKNYYCTTRYYNNKTMNLNGYYSGKSTSNRNGRINVTHLSLLDAGPGNLS
tara:strand:+ start:153 stop:710 length:558 start_codon:yes stop_codon:yes gene_type:complete